MLNIAVCDDNMSTAGYVEKYLSEFSLKNINYEIFCSGNDLLDYLNENKEAPAFNLYFMDIEMPGLNGIDTSSYIRQKDKHALIVFITDHKEYVYQVFEVLPFRFIEKPLTKECLYKVLREAMDTIQSMKQLFFFKWERSHYQIPYDEIRYFEGNGRKIRVYTEFLAYDFYGKIVAVNKELDQSIFLQIHASYLVNMDYIRLISESEVVLEGDITLPISKKYRKEARFSHLAFMDWRCG